MAKETTFVAVSPAISKHVENLILQNRAELIKATVKDSATQKELIAVNDAIERIRRKDGSLVAAWGLGCGGSCLVSPGDIKGDPLGIRTK